MQGHRLSHTQANKNYLGIYLCSMQSWCLRGHEWVGQDSVPGPLENSNGETGDSEKIRLGFVGLVLLRDTCKEFLSKGLRRKQVSLGIGTKGQKINQHTGPCREVGLGCGAAKMCQESAAAFLFLR